MTSFRADLHCHSTCSDGTLTPKEIIDLALDIGLNGLAITDHDTVDAYRFAIPYAEQRGIRLLTGIEFSSEWRGFSVHLLGYGFNIDHAAIQSLCLKHAQRRSERNEKILENLKKLGKPLTLEEIIPNAPHHTIGRPHIALAMVKKGYVASLQEAFKKYIGDGKPAYVKGQTFSAQETLETLHAAGGKAIIAHPHLIEHTEVLRGLLEMEFDGIECFYAKFGPEQNARWVEIAKKKKWIMTGGSDFHGAVKPGIPLGSSWVNEETFNLLLPPIS